MTQAKKSFRDPGIRVPPQDTEAEKALLGCIMLKPSSINGLADYLSTEAFYADKHALIYKTMLDLYVKNEPIDLLSVTARLKDQKNLARIGGAAFLSELVNLVPSASNVDYYARLVHKKSVLRGLIESAEEIAEASYGETDNIEDLLDNAEQKIFRIANFSSRQKFVNIKETLEEAWERLDRLHKSKDEIRGIRTGFSDLDNKLAGLQKSDLIILAARPSMGKTTLALDIARHAACKYETPVGIFSLEMSSQQLVDRMLASESRVDSWKLRTGKLTTDMEFSLIRDSLDRLAKAPIYIDDEASNTILKMRAVSRRLKAEHGLGLIVVDYLQLMVPNRNIESLVQQVTEISRSLKGLARELDVPVLALSQLNRSVEKRGDEPRLSDLRDSGSIEQDADVVLFIHRDDRYSKDPDKPNIAKIIIAKHRNGPTGSIELFFDEKRVSFATIEKGNFGDF